MLIIHYHFNGLTIETSSSTLHHSGNTKRKKATFSTIMYFSWVNLKFPVVPVWPTMLFALDAHINETRYDDENHNTQIDHSHDRVQAYRLLDAQCQ